jgi:hypothetical protein
VKTRFLRNANLAALLVASGVAFAQAPAPAAPANARPAATPARQGYGAGYQARQMTATGSSTGGASQAAGPQASTPDADIGPDRGAGQGMRRGRGGIVGPDFTPGWNLMTQAERNEHRARVAATKTYDECMVTMTQHREQLAARAKERGLTMATPRRDACAAMKP